MKILVVYATSRLIIPIDSNQQDCLLHAREHGVRWDVFLLLPCCILHVHHPPPRAFVTKGSYNFCPKSSSEVTLPQAYVLY